jgi:hypothetical protein
MLGLSLILQFILAVVLVCLALGFHPADEPGAWCASSSGSGRAPPAAAGRSLAARAGAIAGLR